MPCRLTYPFSVYDIFIYFLVARRNKVVFMSQRSQMTLAIFFSKNSFKSFTPITRLRKQRARCNMYLAMHLACYYVRKCCFTKPWGPIKKYVIKWFFSFFCITLIDKLGAEGVITSIQQQNLQNLKAKGIGPKLTQRIVTELRPEFLCRCDITWHNGFNARHRAFCYTARNLSLYRTPNQKK